MSRLDRMWPCLCVLILLQQLHADDSPPSMNSSAPAQQVIVLLGGRVVSGNVREVPGGYLVESSLGSMVISLEQVRLTAKDLPEAYRKLDEGMTEPTAGHHVSLGRWCFENRLYTSAREQVKAALLIDPERKEARALLTQIERVTSGRAVESTAAATSGLTRAKSERSRPETLGGLSPQATQDFVRKVQPLLMNKCGNARCHGAAGSSDFRLAPVRLGISGFRTLTDQNLDAVLSIIDADQPGVSPLLTIPQGEHGGNGRIWTGPRTEEQLADLRGWVTQVARERSAVPASEQSPIRTATGEAASASPAGENSTVGRDSFLDEILAEQRPDKFEPAIFNRLMHGRD